MCFSLECRGSTIDTYQFLKNKYKNSTGKLNYVYDPWAPKDEVYGKEVTCDYPGCKCKTINSHLIQRGTMLKDIAENGMVLQMCDDQMQPLIDDEKQYMLLPIKKAMSLPVFCPQHDNRLFKQIEKRELDVHNDRNVLLLSYRALCGSRAQEIRRQKFYETIPNYNTFCQGGLFDIKKNVSQCAIDDIGQTIERLYADIKKHDYSRYQVIRYRIHRVGICVSDCIFKEKDFGAGKGKSFSPLFVHVIPMKDCTWVVFLYEKDYVTQTTNDVLKIFDVEGVEKYMIELLAMTNNWCVSPSLFGDDPQCMAECIFDKKLKWCFED